MAKILLIKGVIISGLVLAAGILLFLYRYMVYKYKT